MQYAFGNLKNTLDIVVADTGHNAHASRFDLKGFAWQGSGFSLQSGTNQII
jgi:hypothetical protein